MSVFLYWKPFHTQKNKQARNCPDNLIILYYWCVPLLTHLLRIYLYMLIFICDYLWESFLFMKIFLICGFLSLYENKHAYEYQYLKQIFCHQKTHHDILLTFYVPIFCFLPWVLLILCLIIFLLNKVSLNSLNSVAIFTTFSVSHSLPSVFSME